MLRVAHLSSYLPLCCKPKAPYESIEAALEALKSLNISQIGAELERYNWLKILPPQLEEDALALLKELPLPKTKESPIATPFWQRLIPSFRIDSIAQFITFIAICVLRAAMVDLQNPPRTSWDASRQLELMLKGATTTIEYSKGVRSYFSTPLRGHLAILATLIAVKFLHALLSHIIQRALPKQNMARNLSEEAKKGVLRSSSLLGRTEELEAMKVALHSDSNVCLLGPTGVGKTALVEALALAIEKGEVDSNLKGKTVLLANAAELVGNTYQWDQESGVSRPPLDALIASMQGKEDRYILFIDEIHAATGQEGRSSANLIQVLKSKIDGTRFPKVIIATTKVEYEKSLASDTAFERRFVKIAVEDLPPDVVKTLLIQEYAHVLEKGEDIASSIELFTPPERTVAFPACILQLFKLVHANLTTFRNPELTRSLEEKRQQLESARATLLINRGDISTIQALNREIEPLEEKLRNQRALFQELWAICDKKLDLLKESIHLARNPPSSQYDLSLREKLFKPALEAQYADKKAEYHHISQMNFIDKAPLDMIQALFEAYKPSLLGISSS